MAVFALVAVGCSHVERVNGTDVKGNPTNGVHEPLAIDGDGSVVAFSSSDYLAPEDHEGVSDVYARDRKSKGTALMSISPDGMQDPLSSDHPSVSGDGRFVSFTTSSRDDLVPLPPGMIGTRVYVKDRVTGGLEQIAVPGDGGSTGDASRLDGDGRHVAFNWLDIRPGGAAVTGVYVFDRSSRTLVAASVGSHGQVVGAFGGSISDDGRFVSFVSTPAAVVDGSRDTHRQVFVRDLALGTTTWASVDASGAALPGDFDGTLSGDGASLALVQSTAPYHVFHKDLASGAVVPVDVRGCATATPSTGYTFVSTSDDGEVVAFSSNSPDLVQGDTNGKEDVFVWRAWRPCDVELISRGTDRQPGDGDSYWPAVSGDGRAVAFVSRATDLVPDDRAVSSIADAYVWTVGRLPHRLDG